MAIFKLNDLGGYEDLESLCVRSKSDLGEFDRFKKVEARDGRVELELKLSRRYEAQCDMTVEEALRVAVQLVEAAEHAEVQRQAIEAERAAALAAARERRPRRKGATP